MTEKAPKGGWWKFGAFAIASQLMFLALYAFAVDWAVPLRTDAPYETANQYPMWQDIHVMMYVGFGFLLVFPGKNLWNSVGFAFMMGVYTFQWALLTNGFFEWIYDDNKMGHIHFSMTSLIRGDFCVAAILISYSAVVGKLSPFQLLFMCFVETFLWSLNGYICEDLLQANDIGGAMTIHTFGAYFGLALMLVYYIGVKKKPIGHPGWNSTHMSDTFAMIGTLFLWMYWPSYNAALAPGGANIRAVTITVLALTASCLTACAICLTIRGKFNMFDVQNATLAGGVATGACADLAISPWAGILLGIVAGTISILGYIYLFPFLEKTIKLHDTAGIHNLHALPGILGGLASIFASLAAQDDFWQGEHIGHIQHARSPTNATLAASYGLEPGLGRSANTQAGYQAAALAVCIFLGIAGGLGTGIILRLPFFDKISYDNMFDDSVYWMINHDEEEAAKEVPMNNLSAGSVGARTERTPPNSDSEGDRPKTKV